MVCWNVGGLSQAFKTIFLHLNKWQIHKESLCNAVFLHPPHSQLQLEVVFNPLDLSGTFQKQIGCFWQRLRYLHFLSLLPSCTTFAYSMMSQDFSLLKASQRFPSQHANVTSLHCAGRNCFLPGNKGQVHIPNSRLPHGSTLQRS